MSVKINKSILAWSLCTALSLCSLSGGAEELQPGPAASPAIQIVSFNNVARPGDTVTLKLRVTAGTSCSIEADRARLAEAFALPTRTPDQEGLVSWSWEIPQTYRAELMPVIVTLKVGGHEHKLVTGVKILGKVGPGLTVRQWTKGAGNGDSVICGVQTIPDANCRIEVGGLAPNKLLTAGEQRADKEGMASWTLHMPPDFKADKLPVIITSSADGRESKLVTAVQAAQLAASRPELGR